MLEMSKIRKLLTTIQARILEPGSTLLLSTGPRPSALGRDPFWVESFQVLRLLSPQRLPDA